jgi:hypothetical protein
MGEFGMIRVLVAAIALGLACAGLASAQAPRAVTPQPFTAEEIISALPGRWEHRIEGASKEALEAMSNCKKFADRIWFRRGEKGLIYHSQNEAPGSIVYTSRVGIPSLPFLRRSTIRVQYEGEGRQEDNGKPVVWEIYMTERDTFYWHRVGWPPGTTTPPVRRCKEEVTS